VSWAAPTFDGGSSIIGSAITALVGFGPVKYWIFNTPTTPTTTHVVTGLTNGTQYRVPGTRIQRGWHQRLVCHVEPRHTHSASALKHRLKFQVHAP
jgi:hypothetical protein